MRYETRKFTGYATKYKSVYSSNSGSIWASINDAFDWSPNVSPEDTSAGAWRETAALADYTYASHSMYLDGIGTWKCFLDLGDNFNDQYTGTGQEYTDFSFIPETPAFELVSIEFKIRHKHARDNQTHISILCYKGDTRVGVDNDGNLTTPYIYGYQSSYGEDGITATIPYNKDTFQFYKNSKYHDIGKWTFSDIKSGLFLPRIGIRNRTNTVYIAGFSLTIECKIYYQSLKVSTQYSVGGSVSCDKKEFLRSDTATVVATPDPRYELDYWLVNDERVEATGNILNLSMDNDKTVVAVFKTKVGYVSYDSIFNYARWRQESPEQFSGFEVTDEGVITLRGSITSPKFRVHPSTKYVLSTNAEYLTRKKSYTIYIYYYRETFSQINSLSMNNTPLIEFETPENCRYVSLRIYAQYDIRVSNLIVYEPAEEFRKSLLPASQRCNSDRWIFPKSTINKGYIFYGWNTKPDGTGEYYDMSSPYPKEDLILYSQWRYPIFYKGVPAKYIAKNGLIGSLISTGSFFKNPLYLNVTFYNWDGSIHETVRTLYGHYPECSTTPTRPSDASYDYNFIGWDKEIVPCKQDTFYIARYQKITK